jgi:hypothetical protein
MKALLRSAQIAELSKSRVENTVKNLASLSLFSGLSSAFLQSFFRVD